MHKVLFRIAKWKKLLGRHKHRWKNTIKMCLKQIGFGDLKSVCLTLDRDQWQVTVNYLRKFTFHRLRIIS